MIYLDYAATHPMTDTALQAYVEAVRLVGNPASVHTAGQAAREKLEEGRHAVAQVLQVDPRLLLCNSGATEGNNHAILGLAQLWQQNWQQNQSDLEQSHAGHLISTPTEHAATLGPIRHLESQGWTVSWLTPDRYGYYRPEELQELLQLHPNTALCSVHLVNNELGSIQNIAEFATICQEHQVHLHCDAVQAAGIVPLRPEQWGLSVLTLSAHKWGGPRGVGFMYLRRGVQLPPLLLGGGQEAGLRAGTQNTAGVYAAGMALQEAEQQRAETWQHLQKLKQLAITELCTALPDVCLNVLDTGLDTADTHDGTSEGAHESTREASPKILNVTLPCTDGEALLMNLDMLGVNVSSGSACSAGTVQVSHVLLALGLSEAEARSSLRLSFGRMTTEDEVRRAVQAIVQAVQWSRV